MEEVANNPIYLDWAFWAVIVSLVAIILSQIPPIHLLLKKAAIDIELYSKISITHKVGNPNLQLHLQISNTGGSKIRVKEINASISRDNNHITNLPVQNYLRDPNDTSPMFFTSFSLLPNQEWSHIINLLNFYNRENENHYRAIEEAMVNDFNTKRALVQEDTNELIELSPDVVHPAHDFFERNFIWLPGEYKLTLNVLTDNDSANISKDFRFTIFESHSSRQRTITDQYKYGGGIWWDPKNIQTSVIIDISQA